MLFSHYKANRGKRTISLKTIDYTSCFLLHLCIRNDGHSHNYTSVKSYRSIDEAIINISKMTNGSVSKENISRYIHHDEGIWIWQCQEKSNGDYYKISDGKNITDGYLTFDFDVKTAVVVEE